MRPVPILAGYVFPQLAKGRHACYIDDIRISSFSRSRRQPWCTEACGGCAAFDMADRNGGEKMSQFMSASDQKRLEEGKSKLLSAYIKMKDMNDYACRVSEIIGGLPVMLISAAFKLIGGSSVDGVDDEFWINNFRSGYSPFENTKYIMENLMGEIRSKRPREVYFVRAQPFKYARMIVNLMHNGQFYGHMSALCVRPCDDAVAQELFRLAADLVIKLIVVDANPIVIPDDITAEVLADLIGGGLNDREMLSARRKAASLENARVFQIINIETQVSSNRSLQAELKNRFAHAMPGSTIFIYREQLLIFLSGEHAGLLNGEMLDRLRTLLTEIEGSAAVSDEFSDLFTIRQHYEKNRRLSTLKQIVKGDTISFYDRYKQLDMTTLAVAASDAGELSAFARSAILEMRRYDRENGTEYVRTLWCYFRAHESLRLAAEMLFIHRNTIVYRLDRMKKLFGIELNSYGDNAQYYYSCCICMLCDALSDGNRRNLDKPPDGFDLV